MNIIVRTFLVLSGVIFVCEGNVPTLTPVTAPVVHGEEPHWDERLKVLYYVDVYNQLVLRLNPETGNVTQVKVDGGPVGPVIPIRDTKDELVVCVGRKLVQLKWPEHENLSQAPTRFLTSVEDDKPTNLFNDGKADARGRLWMGTIGPQTPTYVKPNEAGLYRMSGKNFANITTILKPVSISNGLVWNRDNTKFYYVDTETKVILGFDFDVENGEICNQQVVFDLANYKDVEGECDGMTIDLDGNLWVAMVHGSAVLKVDPRTGKLLQKIKFPVVNVTSVMFGGANFEVLYVTTSRLHLTAEEIRKQPLAGCVFTVTNLENVRGFPAFTAVLK